MINWSYFITSQIFQLYLLCTLVRRTSSLGGKKKWKHICIIWDSLLGRVMMHCYDCIHFLLPPKTVIEVIFPTPQATHLLPRRLLLSHVWPEWLRRYPLMAVWQALAGGCCWAADCSAAQVTESALCKKSLYVFQQIMWSQKSYFSYLWCQKRHRHFSQVGHRHSTKYRTESGSRGLNMSFSGSLFGLLNK